MKNREVEINVKVTDPNTEEVVGTIDAKASYQEIENLSEINSHPWENDEKVRAFNYGLYTLTVNKLRAENNLVPVIKRLVEAKIFKTAKEAFDKLIAMKNAG